MQVCALMFGMCEFINYFEIFYSEASFFTSVYVGFKDQCCYNISPNNNKGDHIVCILCIHLGLFLF